MLARLLSTFAAAILLFPSAFPAVAAINSLDTPADLFNASNLDLAQLANGHTLIEPDKWQKQWRGEATIEVYMASDYGNNIGHVTGPAMYDLIQRNLRLDCPDTIGGNTNRKCWGKWHSFDTRYKKDSGEVTGTLDQIHVKTSRYENMQVRNLLIGAIAAAYEESTKLTRNCYYAPDAEAGNRYCNAPGRVGAYTEDSHIVMDLTSDIVDDNDGGWHCCHTREFIDKRLDELMGEFKGVYPTPRTLPKLVECHLGCREDEREFSIDVDKALIELMISGL